MVNFFGHATVALWSADDPAFVFGAMLPDFAGMVGVRIAGITPDAAVQRGIDLHHRTDDAFHGAPIFTDLCSAAMTALTDAGVSRGGARAVGHVGTELLLDGWLADNSDALRLYRDGLQAGSGLIDNVTFHRSDAHERCRFLLSRLSNASIPERYADVDFVTERLVFILASRPRLALMPDEVEAVRSYLRESQSTVIERAPQLIEYVRTQLNP